MVAACSGIITKRTFLLWMSLSDNKVILISAGSANLHFRASPPCSGESFVSCPPVTELLKRKFAE